MREIVVISGKGGTGKTSVCAAFARLADNAVVCDLDVDAPDLHILLAPDIQKTEPFNSGRRAEINQNLCIRCGLCATLCAFDAVTTKNGLFHIDPTRCEGCCVCAKMCPRNAVELTEPHCGDIYLSESRFGPMVHAQLFPGQENSGRLVSVLKTEARKIAREQKRDVILCDGSPGVGCPVISSLAGADLAVGVVEPTPSGRHDFMRAAELCRHFRIPLAVIINKADLNTREADNIAAQCAEHGDTLLGRIPFDPVVNKAMIGRLTLTEFDNPVGTILKDMWSVLQSLPLRR